MPTRARTASSLAALSVFVAAIPLSGCVSRTLEVSSAEDLTRFGRILAREHDDRTHGTTREHAEQLVRTPIHFSGRVVTPDGMGIADANIRVVVFDRVIEPFHLPYFGYTVLNPISTDPEGYFELSGLRGVALHIDASKDGYRPVNQSHRTYQVEHVMPIAEDYPMPERGETALFIFKPRSAAEQLLPIATGAVLVPAEGKVELSMFGVHPHGVPEGTGQIAFSCSRGDISSPRYDWSCRISVPGGGIQLRDRLDFDYAPESGYKEEIELSARVDDTDWRDRADTDVFVRLPDGNYGYLSVSIRTLGDYYVALWGVLNQDGSRLID